MTHSDDGPGETFDGGSRDPEPVEAPAPGGDEHGSEAGTGPPTTLPVRVVRVFVAPGRLFAALRERPVWFTTTLLGAVIVVLSTALIPGDVWDETMRQQMLRAGQELPEGIDFGTIQRVAAIVFGGIFWFVWVFFLAGVLSVVFAFVLGDDGGYRQYLAVTSHALLIPAFGGLATVPLRIIERNPQLTLNLGLFVGLEPGYLMNFLTTLDLFLLWSYVVMAAGVHEIDPRRSWGSATAVILALALLLAAGLAFLIPTS